MDSDVIDAEEIDKHKEDEIAKMFLQQLEDARELISAEGAEVGLCPYCKDTGFIYLERDGYSGIQARIENDVKQFNECYHGEPLEDGSFNF